MKNLMPSGFLLTGIFTLWMLTISCFAQDTMLVRYYDYKNVEANRYYAELLDMALRETEEQDGPFKLQAVFPNTTQRDALKRLRVGDGVDVIFTMSSMARSWVFKAIKFPLTQGYIGLRMILVTPSNKSRFSKITSVEELRHQKLGQGYDWPDTQILKDNGLDVVTSHSNDSLVEMLFENKIDGFPRGVTEYEHVIHEHPNHKMVAADGIYLKYPTDMFFYVKKENLSLARRPEEGLKKGKKDGSFDRIFNKYMGASIKAARLEKRHAIILENPEYTEMMGNRLKK